jgi:uncharacterized protein YdhG (YjbR/CyaY superfamily)
MDSTHKPDSIDDYIASAVPEVRDILRDIRATIRAAAPDAAEVISYGIPAFKGHGVLVFFAAYKRHIGLYPPVQGDDALVKAVAKYAGPKGNLQFPLDSPIPHALIARIVKHRVKQDKAHAAAKAKRKAA